MCNSHSDNASQTHTQTDVQFLTSYTIRVYPDETRCGGSTEVHYTFNNIDKVCTYVKIRGP